MNNTEFKPCLRAMIVSDIHIKDEHSVERERFEKAIRDAYSIARSNPYYQKLDVLGMVGDFADGGTPTQFKAARDIVDANVDLNETKVIASIASHEFMHDGVEAGYKNFREIFGGEPDTHEVVNGFHFVSITPSKGCNYHDDKKEWMAQELRKAAEDDRKKPIFVFQHPHNSGTVYGSILWGEDDLIPIYMHYPQIIHFSGHSHAPINDPRSIHQQHFTSLGTGTLSYFELDEFDKIYSTIPTNKDKAAQMLIVEVDEQNRVRIYPYDVLSGNFFPYVWEIDNPSDPSTFKYTGERYKTTAAPYFNDGDVPMISDITDTSFRVDFKQANPAEGDKYVNSYDIIVKNAENEIIRQYSIWSEYYFYDMPETLGIDVNDLSADSDYTVEVRANSFWMTSSKENIIAKVHTK